MMNENRCLALHMQQERRQRLKRQREQQENWNCFEGIATDSYAASVGSDGDFTGCIGHMGYRLEGVGQFKLLGLGRYNEEGSDTLNGILKH